MKPRTDTMTNEQLRNLYSAYISGSHKQKEVLADEIVASLDEVEFDELNETLTEIRDERYRIHTS